MLTTTKKRLNTGAEVKHTRILIVDDHPVFRFGLKAMLEGQSDFEVCGEAASLAEAMQCFRQIRPEVVITDISLQDGSGIELVKQLVALNRQVKMLVCSMHDENLFADRALRAGAKGYINKEEPPELLITAVRRIVDDHIFLSDKMSERIIGERVGLNHHNDAPAIESLSDRELEVYEQIGRGETTRHIADKLHLSPKTVDTYREKIKAKLNLANATELTQHAVQWVLQKT